MGGQHLRRRRRAAAGEIRQRTEQPGGRRAPRSGPRPRPVQPDPGQVAVDLDRSPLRPGQRRELVLRLGEPGAAEAGGDQGAARARGPAPPGASRSTSQAPRLPAARSPVRLQGGELEEGERHAERRRHGRRPAATSPISRRPAAAARAPVVGEGRRPPPPRARAASRSPPLAGGDPRRHLEPARQGERRRRLDAPPGKRRAGGAEGAQQHPADLGRERQRRRPEAEAAGHAEGYCYDLTGLIGTYRLLPAGHAAGPAAPCGWRSPLAAVALALAAAAEHRTLRGGARRRPAPGSERAGITPDAAELGREPDPERRAPAAPPGPCWPPSSIPARRPGARPRAGGARDGGADGGGRPRRPRDPGPPAGLLGGGAGGRRRHLPRLVAGARPAAVHRLPAVGGAARDGPAPGPRQAGAGALPRRRLPGDLAGALAAQAARSPAACSPRSSASPDDLDRLLDPWLDTAADRREAFAVLPDEPAAWERVEQAYARARRPRRGSRRRGGGTTRRCSPPCGGTCWRRTACATTGGSTRPGRSTWRWPSGRAPRPAIWRSSSRPSSAAPRPGGRPPPPTGSPPTSTAPSTAACSPPATSSRPPSSGSPTSCAIRRPPRRRSPRCSPATCRGRASTSGAPRGWGRRPGRPT